MDRDSFFIGGFTKFGRSRNAVHAGTTTQQKRIFCSGHDTLRRFHNGKHPDRRYGVINPLRGLNHIISNLFDEPRGMSKRRGALHSWFSYFSPARPFFKLPFLGLREISGSLSVQSQYPWRACVTLTKSSKSTCFTRNEFAPN